MITARTSERNPLFGILAEDNEVFGNNFFGSTFAHEMAVLSGDNDTIEK